MLLLSHINFVPTSRYPPHRMFSLLGPYYVIVGYRTSRRHYVLLAVSDVVFVFVIYVIHGVWHILYF